jgi:hypothetical protein
MLFAHWQTYFVLAGMGTTVFLQIKWLNEGLMRFAASYTVPVFMAFWIGKLIVFTPLFMLLMVTDCLIICIWYCTSIIRYVRFGVLFGIFRHG